MVLHVTGGGTSVVGDTSLGGVDFGPCLVDGQGGGIHGGMGGGQAKVSKQRLLQYYFRHFSKAAK